MVMLNSLEKAIVRIRNHYRRFRRLRLDGARSFPNLKNFPRTVRYFRRAASVLTALRSKIDSSNFQSRRMT